MSEIVHQIFSLEEAHEIISYRYSYAESINYFDDDIINYTNPPIPTDYLDPEIIKNNRREICCAESL